jgi:hypothetical protein
VRTQVRVQMRGRGQLGVVVRRLRLGLGRRLGQDLQARLEAVVPLHLLEREHRRERDLQVPPEAVARPPRRELVHRRELDRRDLAPPGVVRRLLLELELLQVRVQLDPAPEAVVQRLQQERERQQELDQLAQLEAVRRLLLELVRPQAPDRRALVPPGVVQRHRPELLLAHPQEKARLDLAHLAVVQRLLPELAHQQEPDQPDPEPLVAARLPQLQQVPQPAQAHRALELDPPGLAAVPQLRQVLAHQQELGPQVPTQLEVVPVPQHLPPPQLVPKLAPEQQEPEPVPAQQVQPRLALALQLVAKPVPALKVRDPGPQRRHLPLRALQPVRVRLGLAATLELAATRVQALGPVRRLLHQLELQLEQGPPEPEQGLGRTRAVEAAPLLQPPHLQVLRQEVERPVLVAAVQLQALERVPVLRLEGKARPS